MVICRVPPGQVADSGADVAWQRAVTCGVTCHQDAGHWLTLTQQTPLSPQSLFDHSHTNHICVTVIYENMLIENSFLSGLKLVFLCIKKMFSPASFIL